MNAIQVAERLEKPLLTDLFTDVYHEMPSNLKEQERSLTETMKKHPQDYPSGFAVWNSTLFTVYSNTYVTHTQGWEADIVKFEVLYIEI